MSEQRFDSFADFGKLNQEKDQVVKIFREVSQELMKLSDQTFVLDGAKSLGQLAKFMREFDQVQGRVSEGLEKVSASVSKNKGVTLQEIEAIKKAKGVTDEYVASLIKLAQSKQVYAEGHKLAGQQREKPMSGFQMYMGANMGKDGKSHTDVSDAWTAMDEDLKKLWNYAAQFTKFGSVAEGVSDSLDSAAEHVHEHAEESKAATDDVKAHTDALKDNTDAAKDNADAQDKWAKAIEAQKARAAGLVASVSTDPVVSRMSDSLGENATQRDNLKAQMAEIRQAKKELAELNQGEFAGQFTEEINRLAEAEELLKIQLQQANQFIRNQAKEFQAQRGSLDEMRAQLNQLNQTYDAMSGEAKSTEAGKALEKQINDLTTAIKEGEFGTQRFFRNVGNYAGSLAPVFDKLGEQLQKLKQEQKSLQDAGVQNLTRNPVGFQIGQTDGPERLNQVTNLIGEFEKLQQIGFQTTGSYTQQIKTLENAYESLAQKGGVSIEFLKEFAQALSEAKQDTRFTSSNFDGAFDVLKNSLDEVRTKLKDPALKGEALKKLQQEEQLLMQLTTGLNKVFTSSTMELRKFQDAAKKVGVEFGTDSQIFLQFTEAVGDAKDQMDDIQSVINRQASDTKYLDSAVAAVNGLAGAYGAAQGAAELFGDGTEDLQRSMVKLQAIMTIINGLQAIQNALQAESGVVQTMLAGKIQLVNAAKAIEAKLFAVTAAAAQAEAIATGESAVAAEAAAVANAQNAAANQAAAVAQGEAAVAAGAATAALEGETVAATTATKATVGFRTALLATGIGAALAAIGVAIAYLVKVTFEWVTENTRALAMQTKLTEAAQQYNQTLVEQSGLLSKSNSSYKNALQAQLSQAQALGKSQAEIFTIRKELAKEEKRIAQENLQTLGATNAAQAASLTKLEGLNSRRLFILEKYNEAVAKGDKRGQEANKTLLEFYDKQYAAEKTIYDAREQARQDSYAADKALSDLQSEEAKFSADERRKLTLESTRIQVDAVTSANALILSNERATLAQRVEALKNNLKAQKSLIEAQKNDVLNDPGASVVDKAVAIRNAAKEEIKATQQANREIEQIREDFRLRDLQANHDMLQRRLEDENELKEKVFRSEQVGLAERLSVFKSYTDNQRQLLEASYKLQLQQAGISDEEIAALQADRNYRVKSKKITDEELLNLQKDHESAVMHLVVDSQEGMVDILRSNLRQREELYQEHVDAIQRILDQADLSSVSDYATDVIALNDALKRKEISLAEYNIRREKLDRDYEQRSTQNLIKFLQGQLDLLVGAEKQELDAKARLAKLKQQLDAAPASEKAAILQQIDLAQEEYDHYKGIVNKKIDLSNRLKNAQIKNSQESTNKWKEDAEARAEVFEQSVMGMLELASAFSSGHYERENQQIQEQMDLLDRRTQKEIDAINATAASKEEKEQKIKKIEATAAAHRQALEYREAQNRQRQARAERDAQVLKIFGETMFQAAKLGFITPAAVAIEIAGAVAIASLMAKPLPGFAVGTDYAPEGPAQVAEEGPELAVDREGNIVLYKEPQVAYLKGGTKVYTAEETEAILGAAPVKPAVKGKALSEPKIIEPKNEHHPLTRYLTQPPIPIERVYRDLFRIQEQEREVRISLSQQIEKTVDRTDDLIRELVAMKRELREIKKKVGVNIYNQSGIESTAEFRQLMKE